VAALYLVDASIYIFQAHFSPHAQVWSRRTEDRSAFVGFLRFLLRFVQTTQKPEAAPLAVAFDESLQSGFRHRLYPDYKSNRVLPDDNLARQLAACARLCEVLGVTAFGSQEYEADDIIGTLAVSCAAQDTSRHLAIVSRDKDLSQLLAGAEDYVWDFYGGVRRKRDDLHALMGIWPEQFPCFLGLTGDSIDCIPGVPGIGPVAARQLLQRFGNLDTLYEQLSDVPGLTMRGAARCAALLAQHRDAAMLSRQLATIVRQAPVTEAFASCSIADLWPRSPDLDAFELLLREMELKDDDIRRFCGQASQLPGTR
jgi:DNA polymerase I